MADPEECWRWWGALRCGSHLLAAFGALSAGCRALLHLLVVAHALATGGTGRTDFGTDAAGLGVELRFTKHEVDAFLTARGAVDQKLDVIGCGVLAFLAGDSR